jgi:hypothetical protein
MIERQSHYMMKYGNFNFNFNLFSVHVIHKGYDPSDMKLVNTEIRLQVSYMK